MSSIKVEFRKGGVATIEKSKIVGLLEEPELTQEGELDYDRKIVKILLEGSHTLFVTQASGNKVKEILDQPPKVFSKPPYPYQTRP